MIKPETRLEQAERQLKQAHVAFMQDPTPRLAVAMRQLAAVVMYERRCARKALKDSRA
jgi:hypothetical protein